MMSESKSSLRRTAEFGCEESFFYNQADPDYLQNSKWVPKRYTPSRKPGAKAFKLQHRKCHSFDKENTKSSGSFQRNIAMLTFAKLPERSLSEEKNIIDSKSTDDQSRSLSHQTGIRESKDSKAPKSKGAAAHTKTPLSKYESEPSKTPLLPFVIPPKQPVLNKIIFPPFIRNKEGSDNLKLDSKVASYSLKSIIPIKFKKHSLQINAGEKNPENLPNLALKPKLIFPKLDSRLAKHEAWVMKKLFGQTDGNTY